ncbi:hypothetical protein SAMN06265795_106149 [Noviherbaspirillum humi]|uniref:CHAP domain-containing protein n=1 Tax=Noviherbaspirillum humi TaxID=1688639 RepID=A0A239H9B6_9BURK|nr:hypothetical protein [Noviherbaspirillum humi]SNS77999.1 hypothetical protein SAMN06265795_106149 [Noviherbaspirillum humi]
MGLRVIESRNVNQNLQSSPNNPVLVAGNLAGNDGTIIPYQIATSSKTARVQQEAEKLLNEFGVFSVLKKAQQSNHYSWTYESVYLDAARLQAISKALKLPYTLPATQICAAMVNYLRVRAGLRTVGTPPSYIPAMVADVKKNGTVVKASEAQPGDIAILSGGGHSGTVIRLANGELKVLAFTGNSATDATAQIVPIEFAEPIYRVK